MAKQLQLRRGTTAQHSTFTGAVGEVTIDTDKDVVVVHDGSTAGGKAMVKEADTAYTIATVDDFGTVPVGYTTVIVKDTDRGGVFNRIASTTANGGTIFDGTTGYSWERQYSGAVNVKWFGAKGDGVTDDTESWIKCVNYVGSMSYIDSGGNAISSTILLPDSMVISAGVALFNGMKVTGNERGSTIVVNSNATESFSVFYSDGSTSFSSVHFSNFTIDGNGLDFVGSGLTINGIYIAHDPLNKLYYSSFKNILIKEMYGHSIYIGNGERLLFDNSIFRDSYLDNFVIVQMRHSIFNSVFFRTAKNLNVANNFTLDTDIIELSYHNNFSNCKFEQANGYNLYLKNAAYFTFTNCSFIYSFQRAGIYLFQTSNITISSSTINNNATYGIEITGNGTNNNNKLMIENCIIEANANSGIGMFYMDYSKINNCKIINNGKSSSTDYGIKITRSVYNVISGNYFEGTEQKYCIYFAETDARFNVVANNEFVSYGSGKLNGLAIWDRENYLQDLKRIGYSNNVPTTQSWKQGDIIYHTDPVAGGYLGWVCTESGTPGTWKTFGAISA